MTADGLPLPTDAELTPEALEILGALPPLNVFRAVAALPASAAAVPRARRLAARAART